MLSGKQKEDLKIYHYCDYCYFSVLFSYPVFLGDHLHQVIHGSLGVRIGFGGTWFLQAVNWSLV